MTSDRPEHTGHWPVEARDVMAGDQTVALGYRTPAGGVVVLPVSTMGMFDEAAGTVTFTTPFAGYRKLERIRSDGRVALAYHAREHGAAQTPAFVEVHGHATFPDRPDDDFLADLYGERWGRFSPPRHRGRVWDWLGREYYDLRLPITVHVHRISVWSDLAATGAPTVVGAPPPAESPTPQPSPKNGTAPRVSPSRYRRRLERSRHAIAGWTGADGYPVLRPVETVREGDRLRLAAATMPPAHRRAGLLTHWFGAHMLPQGSAIFTGWLGGDGDYAPHTVAGYAGPSNELVSAIGTTVTVKLGHRQAVRRGLVVDGAWHGPPSGPDVTGRARAV